MNSIKSNEKAYIFRLVKSNPTMYLYWTHTLDLKETSRLKVKGWMMIYHAILKSGVAILLYHQTTWTLKLTLSIRDNKENFDNAKS